MSCNKDLFVARGLVVEMSRFTQYSTADAFYGAKSCVSLGEPKAGFTQGSPGL